MDDEGITNVYIDSILSQCTYYRGVFSCDNIPKTLSSIESFAIVCNLSKEDEKGSHFVCIIAFPKYILYIDSFGVPCVEETIKQFLSSLGRPVFYNARVLQSSKSFFCGYFCILFVLYHENQKTNFKLCFNSDNLLTNDAACVRYICKLLENK